MIELHVNLGTRSYPVRIGPWRDWDLRTLLGVDRLGDWAIVADERVWELWGKDLLASFGSAGIEASVLCLPGGEGAKNHETLLRIYDFLVEKRIRRDGVLAVFGGGVLGDVGGFAAGTYQRGIRCVQIPTTLLSMVDSSVGGKTGLNYRTHKNLIGVFHQPAAVLIATDWLRSLSLREFRSGLGEVVKCGAIRDVRLLDLLEEHDPARLVGSERIEEVIARALAVKAQIVEADEQDHGLRHLLNYGHTVGHAIESVTGFTRYLHGEAVSLGIVAAAQLSTRVAGLAPGAARRIEALLDRYALPVRAEGIDPDAVLTALAMDKKSTARTQPWVLTPELGRATVSSQVPREHVREAVAYVLCP